MIRLDGKERTIAKALGVDENQKKEYPCVWYPDIVCPIRTEWKLMPENLAPWCAVCKDIGYLDKKLSEFANKDK